MFMLNISMLSKYHTHTHDKVPITCLAKPCFCNEISCLEGITHVTPHAPSDLYYKFTTDLLNFCKEKRRLL